MLCLRKVGHGGFFVYVHPVLQLLVAAGGESQSGYSSGPSPGHPPLIRSGHPGRGQDVPTWLARDHSLP
jgi:hypothetical protein